MHYFCGAFKWSGSSAWLEYMPVTHGVAGSSPVQTAKIPENREPEKPLEMRLFSAF